MFLVNSHQIREPGKRTSCHENVLPEVPTPERLNSLLPTFEVLTDETLVTSTPIPPMSSPFLPQWVNVNTDRICNYTTPPLPCNINGSDQLFISDVCGEKIKTVMSSPAWGLKSADESVAGEPYRTTSMGAHTSAEFHGQMNSKDTKNRYIEEKGNIKWATDLTNNCINYIAPSTLRQARTYREQIPSLIATDQTSLTPRMESKAELNNDMNNSNKELVMQITEKPFCDKHCETTNSTRKDIEQSERNGSDEYNGIVNMKSSLINEACHEIPYTTGCQMQEQYTMLGSSSKRYILIATTFKRSPTSRRKPNVKHDDSSLLTSRPSSANLCIDDQTKTEDGDTHLSTLPHKVPQSRINKSHANNACPLEYDNPTYLKLSKHVGFPRCLPSPDKNFLSALLCEDDTPFEEWFAAESGDIGPVLKEFVTETKNKTQLQSPKGKESKTELAKEREPLSEMNMEGSLGGNEMGNSVPEKSEIIEKLSFTRKEAGEATRLPMARASQPSPNKLVFSSPVADETIDFKADGLEEKVFSHESARPVELADHQYSLSKSPSVTDVLTSVISENKDDLPNNLHRKGNVFETREINGYIEGQDHDYYSENRRSAITMHVLGENDKDVYNFAVETAAFGTARRLCEGTVNAASLRGRRRSLRVRTLNTPGSTCITDRTVPMRQSGDSVQDTAKHDDDVERSTPDTSSIVSNVMQRRKGSTLYVGDVNTNQNCSREEENEIRVDPSFDSKKRGRNQSSLNTRRETNTPVREQKHTKRQPTKQRTVLRSMSQLISPNTKNNIKMKAEDVRHYENKHSQDTTNTSVISDTDTGGYGRSIQSKKKHSFNLRSCNRYKNQPSDIAAQSSHKEAHESSVNTKKDVQGGRQTQGDYHHKHVKDNGGGVDGNHGDADTPPTSETQRLINVVVTSDNSKESPDFSSSRTDREQKIVSQPIGRESKRSYLQHEELEASSENVYDRRLTENTCGSCKSDGEIKVQKSGHSTINCVAKEPSPGCDTLRPSNHLPLRSCVTQDARGEKKIRRKKEISPNDSHEPSNRTTRLLKIKFPFLNSDRKTRKVNDQIEKDKGSREFVTTSSSMKPKMRMKLRLMPLRKGLHLKQSAKLSRETKDI